MDTAWVHQISPFLLEFSNGFGIRYYGLAYIAGFMLAYYFTYSMAKKGRLYVPAQEVQDLIVFIAIGTMVGGRLGYVFFYRPDLLFEFDQVSLLGMKIPLWSALAVHKGGMASHGGILGVIIACIWFAVDTEKTSKAWNHSRWTLGLGYFFGACIKGVGGLFGKKDILPGLHFRFPPMLVIDFTTLGGALGFFFGRIANFINGELYGREAPATLSWAVKFPSEIYTWYSGEAAKLKMLSPAAEALGSLRTSSGEIITAQPILWSQWVDDLSGRAAYYVDLYKEAIVLATQKGNEQVIQALAPALTPRYPSQLIQAVLEGLCVFIVLMIAWRKPQKPGFISAIYGLAYPAMRIVGEHFRLPDAHLGFQAFGLTRGQWLSIEMMIPVFVYLWIVIKSDQKKIGGWR